jgi:hypothetical protein
MVLVALSLLALVAGSALGFATGNAMLSGITYGLTFLCLITALFQPPPAPKMVLHVTVLLLCLAIGLFVGVAFTTPLKPGTIMAAVIFSIALTGMTGTLALERRR